MNDNVALFGVSNNLNRLHRRATFAGSVAGIYINVQRPQAERAVVARGVSERLDLFAAMGADKTVVILRKSFALHRVLQGRKLIHYNYILYSPKCQDGNGKDETVFNDLSPLKRHKKIFGFWGVQNRTNVL